MDKGGGEGVGDFILGVQGRRLVRDEIELIRDMVVVEGREDEYKGFFKGGFNVIVVRECTG